MSRFLSINVRELGSQVPDFLHVCVLMVVVIAVVVVNNIDVVPIAVAVYI